MRQSVYCCTRLLFYESVRGRGSRFIFSRPAAGTAQPSVLLVQGFLLWGELAGRGGEADQSPSGDELTNECGCASTYLYTVMTLTGTASLFAVLCVFDLLLQSVVTFSYINL